MNYGTIPLLFAKIHPLGYEKRSNNADNNSSGSRLHFDFLIANSFPESATPLLLCCNAATPSIRRMPNYHGSDGVSHQLT